MTIRCGLAIGMMLALGTAGARAWEMPVQGLPLGPRSLATEVTAQELADGVTFYHVARGAPDPQDVWTATLGFYRTAEAAAADAALLTQAGFTPSLEPGAASGVWLDVGRFPAEAAARAMAARIAASLPKRRPGTRHTGLAGGPTTGPWLLNILAIDLAHTRARLAIALPGGDDLGEDGETVSAAARRLGPLAATNGSFFTNIVPPGERTRPRAPVGATVIDGRLVAAATGGKPGVMLTTGADGHQSVRLLAHIATRILLEDQSGAAIAIRTIDRPILGTVVNCGTPAEAPTTLPAHDVVCTNADDLVLYDDLYAHGRFSNTRVNPAFRDTAFELVVDAAGAVMDGHTTLGAAPPPGGYVLQGLGSSAAWLRAHATAGTKLAVSRALAADGAQIALVPGLSILEGGPSLSVADLDANAAREGFGPTVNGTDAGDASGLANDTWYNGWYVGRNGRTDIGLAADGTVLLVEIDGRQPGLSLGTSIAETAAVMRWLGAVSALNLDGGGSSNMVVQGRSVGHPSDAGGERGVGDTIVVMKESK